MPKIFLSYRRDDSADVTGRIHDWLTAKLGSEMVFRDVDDIPIGVDFKDYLENAVSQCGLMLVVIGPQWLTITDASGQRRLDDARDFVRIEVESALNRNIPVIPLLVSNATMPEEAALPSTMFKLAYRNGMSIRRDPDFRSDMDRLIRALESQLPLGKPVSTSVTTSSDQAAPFVLPRLEWCDIPASNVLVVSGISRIQGFRISKFPVTVEQYQVFIDAPDGYYDERWWNTSAHCLAWHRANQSAALPRFDLPNCPREMVNWYEALAFCQWLSDKIHSSVALPTHPQWRLAAQGSGSQDYPWGNGFDRTRCNTREGGINHTSPVDRYDQGVSPFGVYDMIGNVWEWTLTEHESGANNTSSKLPRSICGGSWHDFQTSIRAAKRGSPVEERTGDLGFRLASPILK